LRVIGRMVKLMALRALGHVELRRISKFLA
jgi:hypothetical protein